VFNRKKTLKRVNDEAMVIISLVGVAFVFGFSIRHYLHFKLLTLSPTCVVCGK